MEKKKSLCFLVRIYRQLSQSFNTGHEWKCKHHYHFQTTAITTLVFGNVEQSSCRGETRQTIFSTVLTDYIHTTWKCPGSCCWYYYTLFQTFDTSEELRGRLHYNSRRIHWSWTVLSHDVNRWQLAHVMWQQWTFWDATTNSDFYQITGGESL